MASFKNFLFSQISLWTSMQKPLPNIPYVHTYAHLSGRVYINIHSYKYICSWKFGIAVFSLYKISIPRSFKGFWLIIARSVKICKLIFKFQNSTFISIECSKIHISMDFLTTECHEIGSLYETNPNYAVSVLVSMYVCI